MNMFIRAVVAASLCVIGAGGLSASGQSSAAAPAGLAAYGALPAHELVQLSPSAKRLAFVTVNGEKRVLVVLDLATKAQIGGADVGTAKVRDLTWIGEERIMIVTTRTERRPDVGLVGDELATGQIYDLKKGKIFPMLTSGGRVFPGIFSTPAIVPDGKGLKVLVRAFNFDNPERLDMYRVDLDTGHARLDEVMGMAVTDFVLGPDGESIARGEYDRVSKVWSLHLKQGGGFKEVWRTVAPIDTPSLIGLGIQGDSVLISAKRPDLSKAGVEDAEFFDVNMATGTWRPVRFEFRASGLYFHPITHRLIGVAGRSDAGPTYVWVDPAAQALADSANRAFAGRKVSISSWSDDLRKAVVFTQGGTDAGTYQMVDLDAGKVMGIGAEYPAIASDRVAPVRPVTYAAADGLEIHGYLTTPPGTKDAKGLPLIVFPHGGPAAHDTLGFDWWAQAMASRGYAVLQPNFRGSTGYGEAFMEAGYGEWGRKMQTDLSDGVRYLVKEGIADPKRVCIVGASYGGYAALAGPTVDRGVYRCAVSVAGPSDLRLMVDRAANLGASGRDNTSTRYWNRFMGAERLGDRSLDDISPAKLTDKADAPILLIHGRDDSVVNIEQSRIMASALKAAGKPVEFIELDGEDHWLSRSTTRQRMLEETVRFLEAKNPPG